MPEYEIIKWDLNRFPLEKNEWVRQAYQVRKYAFAADFIRLYALYTEGGIYLDSDVEVLKSFNDLLHLPYFICKENSPQGLEAAVIGAEANNPWIGECLKYYKGKTFLDRNGKENKIVLPRIIMNSIEKRFIMVFVNSIKEIENSEKAVYILPSEFFSPKNYVTKRIKITKNTYSIHHFAGTWIPLWKKMALRLWVPFSIKFPLIAEKIKKR